MRRSLVLLTVLFVISAGSATVPRTADATVPGTVGRIVFVSTRDHVIGELYTRDFAGGSWTRLTSNSNYEAVPAWSPDGSKIAYAANIDSLSDIWLMDADGVSQRNLTNDAFFSYDPDWSPDGTQIAYMSDAGGLSNIWVMDADGSGKTNLTHLIAGTVDLYPAWSPDGSEIAFESNTSGISDIWVIDIRSKQATNLTKSATSEDTAPTWSPDGSQIAFVSDRSGSLDELHVMDADGSNVRRLTHISTPVVSPAWSPDGRHIMFMSSPDGDADLWMIDPDGSNLGHLTDHVEAERWGAWESVNRPPVAIDDAAWVLRGGSVTIDVLANDSDPDGDDLSLDALVTLPAHGSITNKWVTSFVYQHDGSAAMADSFTYRVQDTRSGVSNVAKATITVTVPLLPVGDTVGLVDPSSGVWRLRNGAGVVSQFYYGNPADYPFVGDWDCDGTDTPGLYRQSDGFAYLRNTNTQGNADVSFFFGNPGDVPIAGDFNADGCDTLSIYRPANQRFYVINKLGADGGGLGAADYEFLFGNPSDSPVVGDWDGDGVDEIGLYRETSGFFYYRNTLSTGVADGQFYFGNPGDRFVAGDWGIVDGKETPGLFRPSNVTFFFRHTLTQGNADSQFTWTGADTDSIPVAGDFNLD